MAGKFQTQFTHATEDISAMFNRSIRAALTAGLVAAIRETVHDSSNAGFHWMVAERSRSRPGNRTRGTVRDLRSTKGVRGPARPATHPVGMRGAGGANMNQTINVVRTREQGEVIDKVVAGRNVSGNYYFYHGLVTGKTDISGYKDYYENANIEAAGQAAVQTVKERFMQEVARGNVRLRFRA